MNQVYTVMYCPLEIVTFDKSVVNMLQIYTICY